MENEQESFTIFEDQADYIDDIHEQFREACKRFTIYCKMFTHPKDWKPLRDDLKKILHYELERSFSHIAIREQSGGRITMRIEDI